MPAKQRDRRSKPETPPAATGRRGAPSRTDAADRKSPRRRSAKEDALDTTASPGLDDKDK